MRLTIAYSKIKKRNLVLINNDTHQRETLSERPIRPPLRCEKCENTPYLKKNCVFLMVKKDDWRLLEGGCLLQTIRHVILCENVLIYHFPGQSPIQHVPLPHPVPLKPP